MWANACARWWTPSARKPAIATTASSGAMAMISDSRTASLAPFRTASRRPDMTKMSSAPIGRDERRLERDAERPLLRVGLMLGLAQAIGGLLVAGGPRRQRIHPPLGDLGLLAEHPEDVRVLRQEPAQSASHGQPPGSNFQTGRAGRRR